MVIRSRRAPLVATLFALGLAGCAGPAPPVSDFPEGPRSAADWATIVHSRSESIRTLTGSSAPGFQEVLWDFRNDAPPRAAGPGGGFGGPPRGPRVLPGTYTARFGGAELAGETTIEVRAEPRRAISDADRMAKLFKID